MTMPGSRTVTVDGKAYEYVLKKAKHYQLPGWAVRLVVVFRPGQYKTLTFKMTAPTVPGSPVRELPGFTPALVQQVVRALEFHAGKLPDGFEAGAWRLEPSTESIQQLED